MDSHQYMEQLEAIKKWFADGKIEKVFEKLTEIIHNNFSKNVQRDFDKKKLMPQNRLDAVKDKQLLGIADDEEQRIESNKIMYGVINFIHFIESEMENKPQLKIRQKRTYQLGASILLFLALPVFFVLFDLPINRTDHKKPKAKHSEGIEIEDKNWIHLKRTS